MYEDRELEWLELGELEELKLLDDLNNSQWVNDNVQDLIGERRVEIKQLAEEKRKSDLQRIREMKSTEGMNPLQQFPKEIWEMILAELDPEDRGNAWRVHPLFRDLMDQTRVGDILFPQMVNVKGFKESLAKWGEVDFEDLRKISRTTMKSFDRWLDERLKKRIWETEATSSLINNRYVVRLRLGWDDERENLRRLLENFGDAQEIQAKRFLPRAILISYGDPHLDRSSPLEFRHLIREYKTGITALLEKIGDQIWHFQFILDEFNVHFDMPPMSGTNEFSVPEIWLQFQKWIALMPNLKWLELDVRGGLQLIDLKMEKNVFLGRNPFPHLTSLERLSFYSQFPTEISRSCPNTIHLLEIVLGANQHLKMLDVSARDLEGFELFPVDQIKVLPLTHFCSYDQYLYKSVSLSLSWIQNIVNFNWPLTTIALSLDHSKVPESINAIFQMLGNFPTLDKVELKQMKSLPIGDSNHNSFQYLELPNLTHFEVELNNPIFNDNPQFFLSLHFLLHCKKLKTLHWTMRGIDDIKLRNLLSEHERKHPGKVIDFRAGLRLLFDSNIWDIFQHLDTVEVEILKRESTKSCSHEYDRATLDKNISARKLLKSHPCSRRSGLYLGNCVMLLS